MFGQSLGSVFQLEKHKFGRGFKEILNFFLEAQKSPEGVEGIRAYGNCFTASQNYLLMELSNQTIIPVVFSTYSFVHLNNILSFMCFSY